MTELDFAIRGIVCTVIAAYLGYLLEGWLGAFILGGMLAMVVCLALLVVRLIDKEAR